MAKTTYRLTKEHEAQIETWAQKWRKNALNCEAMTIKDREIMDDAMRRMYAAAKLDRPERIGFTTSPLTAALAACFAHVLWENPCNYGTAVVDALDEKLPQDMRGREEIKLQIIDAINDTAPSSGARAPRGIKKQFLDTIPKFYDMWNGGNQWSGWVAYLSFFKHIVGVEHPQYENFKWYELAAIHGGPRMVHPRFTIVSDRPAYLYLDEQNRAHCSTGPFAKWRDGWEIFYYKGVRVSRKIIEEPEKLTAKEIMGERNAERRRVIMEHMGPEKLLKVLKAEPIDDSAWGRLYKIPRPGDSDMLWVFVEGPDINSPTGFKSTWLRPHPECRPLLPNGELGPPQPLTALNAVAASYGQRGEEYAKLVLRT